MMNMWNLFWTVIIIYNEFAIAAVPGAIQNIRVESEFPDTPFRVSFDKPAVGASNTFLKYRITVVPQFGGDVAPCTIRWIVVCVGCGDTTVGATDTFTKDCSAVTKNNAATYKSTDSSYSFLFKDTEIKPSEFYKVHIEAGNTDGWGAKTIVTKGSGQYISGIVGNLRTVNNSNTLVTTWDLPADQKGRVQRYHLWIKDAKDNCVLCMTITCGDCSVLELGNKDAQDFSSCTNKLDNITYNEVQEDFSVSIPDYSNKIKGHCGNLTLYVAAVNKWGWGNNAIISAPDKCCKELDVTVKYRCSSPAEFTIKRETACKDLQYNAWEIDKNNKCVWWKKFNCEGCTSVSVSTKCEPSCISTMSTFLPNSDTIDFTAAVSVGSTVYVAPATDYGWCDATKLSIDSCTGCKMIPCATLNITKEKQQQIRDIMQKPVEDVKDSQISLMLPLSHFKEYQKSLTKFTVVVAFGNIEVPQQKVVEPEGYMAKYYDLCKESTNCMYEILFEKQEIREKRNANTKNYTTLSYKDTPFVVGAHSSCAPGLKYGCNGPLRPNTKYKVGIGAYTENGMITVGVTVRFTKSNAISIEIVVGIVVAVVVLIIIAGILIYWRRSISDKFNCNSKVPVEMPHNEYHTSVTRDEYETDVTANVGEDDYELTNDFTDPQIQNRRNIYRVEQQTNEYDAKVDV